MNKAKFFEGVQKLAEECLDEGESLSHMESEMVLDRLTSFSEDDIFVKYGDKLSVVIYHPRRIVVPAVISQEAVDAEE